jgi:hypothetical protein
VPTQTMRERGRRREPLRLFQNEGPPDVLPVPPHHFPHPLRPASRNSLAHLQNQRHNQAAIWFPLAQRQPRSAPSRHKVIGLARRDRNIQSEENDRRRRRGRQQGGKIEPKALPHRLQSLHYEDIRDPPHVEEIRPVICIMKIKK